MVKISPVSKMDIKLSDDEIKTAGKIIKNYINNPSQKLKTQIADVFAPQIEARAKLASSKSKNISAVDYAQDMYLALFETLENVIKDKKYFVKFIVEAINNTKLSKDDVITMKHKTWDEITPEEESQKFSYKINESSLVEDMKTVINSAKELLTPRELYILNSYLDGKKYKEIGETLDLSSWRIKKLIEAAAKKLRNTEIKYALTDSCSQNCKIIEADKPLLLVDSSNKKQKGASAWYRQLMSLFGIKLVVTDFTSDEVWQMIQKDLPPIDVQRELSAMLKVYGAYGNLFDSKFLQSKLKHKLAMNPDFKFKLELPRRCNNDEFRKEAEDLSVSMFRKNVFEFV